MAYKSRRHLVLCRISGCRTALLKFLKIIHMARGFWAHAKPRRLLFSQPFRPRKWPIKRHRPGSRSMARCCSAFLLTIVTEGSQGFHAQPPHLHPGLPYSSTFSPIGFYFVSPVRSLYICKTPLRCRVRFSLDPFLRHFPSSGAQLGSLGQD